MRTVEQVAKAAIGEVAPYVDARILPRPVMYARASRRLHELFVMAAAWNRAYVGGQAVGDVVAGAANFNPVLNTEDDDSDPAERVHLVAISDTGTADYEAGQRVYVVPVEDAAASIPPAVTFRSGVYEQVRDDLAGVAKLAVYYSRRPRPLTAADDVVELREPFGDLLVLDLAKNLLARLPVNPREARDAALAYFEAEETKLLTTFEAHVRGYGAVVESRF